MPNWCSTKYVIEGDKKEVNELYKLMKKLEKHEIPSVKNDFGSTWLGCIVDALGKDWHDVNSRGYWSELEMNGDVLTFSTETAWAPCNETFDLVKEAFPSLHYYYQSEEPGLCIYETNDEYGTYFTDKFFLDICTPNEEYFSEYFEQKEDAFAWLEEEFGKPIRSLDDIEALDTEWNGLCENSFCYLHEFEIIG